MEDNSKEEMVEDKVNENEMSEKEAKENNDETENNDELTKLKNTILLQKEKLDDQEDRLKRLMAEFDNFKKRSSKEREGLYNSLVSDIFSSLLPVIDNLEKAVEAKTEDQAYKQGVELVLKQFKDVLSANGVQEIEAVGKSFDPELHEAVASVTDESKDSIAILLAQIYCIRKNTLCVAREESIIKEECLIFSLDDLLLRYSAEKLAEAFEEMK